MYCHKKGKSNKTAAFVLKPKFHYWWLCKKQLAWIKWNECGHIWWILDSLLGFFEVWLEWKWNINHRCGISILPPPPKKTSRVFCPQPLDWNAVDTLWFLSKGWRHVEMETRPVWHRSHKETSPAVAMGPVVLAEKTACTCMQRKCASKVTDNRTPLKATWMRVH